MFNENNRFFQRASRVLNLEQVSGLTDKRTMASYAQRFESVTSGPNIQTVKYTCENQNGRSNNHPSAQEILEVNGQVVVQEETPVQPQPSH